MVLNDGSTSKSSRRHGFLLVASLVMVALAGCGGESNPLSGLKLYPVKGKVTLPDGKPLASGRVVFVATKSTITSTAKTESDGSFTFKGGAGGDGLPEGEYKIRLEAEGVTGAKKGTPPFPTRYMDEDASELTATVKPDESSNDFDFKLTSSSSKASSSSPRGGQ
jgi:hypothetical protein